MREKILTFIEKNSRIDTQELAVILGVDETAVMNELEAMRKHTEISLMNNIGLLSIAVS